MLISTQAIRTCQPYYCFTVSGVLVLILGTQIDASKVMLKILQATLQQYVNGELPDVQAGFRKGRGTKLPTSTGSWKKQESSRKNIYFCLIDYAKAFDRVDHNKLWKILKEMVIPDHLTCLLRNLYAGQEATLKLDMEQQTGYK